MNGIKAFDSFIDCRLVKDFANCRNGLVHLTDSNVEKNLSKLSPQSIFLGLIDNLRSFFVNLIAL